MRVAAGLTFTDGAAGLAGVAGWLLGWRPDDFWRATPAELAAVLAVAQEDDGPGAGVDGADLARLRAAMPD